jgi:cytoskeletal protein CcmA (bactofilin family)
MEVVSPFSYNDGTPEQGMETERTTLIDVHGDIEGKLTGKDAQILGSFRGEIELSGRLTTGEGSRVEARVKARVAEIAGEFRGELKVGVLVILEKGRLEGSFEAERLAVREGAQLNGAVNAGAPPETAAAGQAPAARAVNAPAEQQPALAPAAGAAHAAAGRSFSAPYRDRSG